MPASRIGYGLEIFPPRNPAKQAKHWRAVNTLCTLNPAYISVTCGAFGSGETFTREVALKLKAKQIKPVVHFTCQNKTLEEARAIAQQYKEVGLTNIIALRGDVPVAQPVQFKPRPGAMKYAIELVRMLKEMGGFRVVVAAYAETHPEAKSPQQDLLYLKDKLDAGAEHAITQFFLDPNTFLRFRDKAAQVGISQPIVPGILPILNFDRLLLFADKCQIQVPEFIRRLYRGVPSRSTDHKLLAMNILCHQITRLITEGVDFFHFYTLNEITLNTHICKWLKEGF